MLTFPSQSTCSVVPLTSNPFQSGFLERHRWQSLGTFALLVSLAQACTGGGSDPLIVSDRAGGEPRGALLVEPASFLITEGETLRMTARLGGTVVGASQVSWSVSPAHVATIDVQGTLTAVTHGEATVTARYRSTQGTAAGTVRAIPDHIRAVLASAPIGTVGRVVSDSIGILAESADGVAVPGVEVTFDVPSGDGLPSHTARPTGPDGVARVLWTLGTEAGDQTLRATAGTLGEVMIHAEAMPDHDSARVIPVAGDGQEGVVATYLAEPLLARITDQFGNPLPGMGLEWKFESGGGAEAHLENPAGATPIVRTNADLQGLTEVLWRLGTQAGEQAAVLTVVAGVSASSGAVGNPQAGSDKGQKKGWFKWRGNGKPSNPDIVMVSPEQVWIRVGEEARFEATLADAFGNAIEGGVFNWRTDNSGAVALAGPEAVKGIEGGRAAIFADAIDYDLVGSAWVNVASEITYQIESVAGEGQTGPVGSILPDPLRIRVVDGSGLPQEGHHVQWQVLSGGGSISPTETLTNAQGMAQATWTLGGEPGQNLASATLQEGGTASFSATGEAGSVVLTPDSLVFFDLGKTARLTATARSSLGEDIPDAIIGWASTDPAIVRVDQEGVVTSKAWGQALIVATVAFCSASDTTVVSVDRSMVENPPSVELVLDSLSFEEGVWIDFSAHLVNAPRLGDPPPPVAVTASDPGVLLVTDSALLGLTAGQSWVVGDYAGLRDSVAVEILPTQIETLLISPVEASLSIGESLELQVAAVNQAGEPVTGRVFEWKSSDPGVAEVADGRVTAGSVGSTMVSVAVGERMQAASITVEPSNSPDPTDPTLTTDSVSLEKALAYEEQFWAHRERFRQHVLFQIDPPYYTDATARELGYSSGMGLAAYHTNDELTSLARMIEVSRDPERRAFYAAMGVQFLQILIPAIVAGEGTEGCPNSSSRYYCSPGYFRYLDAAHGAGAAGFVMNAIYEDPGLRPLYLDTLVAWSNDLVPTLERHFASTEYYGPYYAPYMPAKIAPAHLAVGKILGQDRYLDAFERIVRVLGASADANGGWIGGDVSHSRVSISAMALAYREQLRGTISGIITPGQLQGVGEGYLAQAEKYDYSGPIVAAYGMLVRFSAGVAANAGTSYSFFESIGSHPLAHVFETVAGLAGGYAIRLPSDPG